VAHGILESTFRWMLTAVIDSYAETVLSKSTARVILLHLDRRVMLGEGRLRCVQHDRFKGKLRHGACREPPCSLT
jgi:hypothetical protein